ncbi:MAG: ATPase, T2SS/T4P/T4SS family [Kiritimatiellae bacterium]|nr:ATPase, T2SS/T4P/T4SS family [Kiritimatiellia bacterium]
MVSSNSTDEPRISDPEREVLAADGTQETITEIVPEMLNPELVAELPLEWAETHLILPILYHGKIRVLMANPKDVAGLNHLASLLGIQPNPVLAPPDVVTHAIQQTYTALQELPHSFLGKLDKKGLSIPKKTASDEVADLLQTAESSPVIQLVNLILLEAVKSGASDIHVEPFESRLRVRYRIDGLLYELAKPPKDVEAALISRFKIMARMDISERRLPQDGVTRIRIGDREIDIRVSSVPVAEGERVVLRILNRDSTLLSLAELGMSDDIFKQWQALIRQPNGIILVCGPTGSGKTTTLYSSIQLLDYNTTNILTIEDPIEYQLPNINQIQVRPKIGLTFANGLRHILRQDPDVILVGEIRDFETAQIAVQSSLTGHLVFSTLHTNDTSSAVIRIMDMGVEPYLLAASLRGVMAQRLARRLCPQCRTPAALTANEQEILAPWKDKIDLEKMLAPAGCESCLAGYRGRVGLYELMIVDADIFEKLRARQSSCREIRELSIRNGMRSMWEDGLNKMAQGITSLNEIIRTIGVT